MSAGRFRLLGKVPLFEQIQAWWDHNWRQVDQAVSSLETGTTGGAVLLDGRSGGQIVSGGTAASEDLILTSTESATKDKIYLGSAQLSAYDELNDRLGLGTAAPARKLDLQSSVNATLEGAAVNSSNGASAQAMWRAQSDSVSFLMIARSSGATATTFGFSNAGWSVIAHTGGGNGMAMGTTISAPLVFGTNNVERARFDTLGNLILQTLGGGLRVKEGANARMGVGVMAAGVLVVANTSVTANTRIFAFSNAVGVVGALANTARVVGTSFTITSAVVVDAGNVAWLLIEPS